MAEKQNNIKLNKSESADLMELKTNKKVSQKFSKRNGIIVALFVILILLYLFSTILFVTPTSVDHSLAFLLDAAKKKAAGFFSVLTGQDGAYSFSTIVVYTIIVLAGAALASAGVVFQGSFKNIIASPTTMGVQSGAVLGNALYLLIFMGSTSETYVEQIDSYENVSYSFLDLNLQQVIAFAGGLISIAIVAYITKLLGRGRFTSGNILFSGMVFSTFVGSITSVIQYYFLFADPDNSRSYQMRMLSMGTFDRVDSFEHLAVISMFIIPCLLYFIVVSPKLNALVLGEDEAATMGINVKQFRRAIIAVGTLMSATIFAFCGQIGFVGFIVPQIARKLVGHDFKRLLISSMALGGILLLIVYNFARWIGFSEYINVITSLIGCTMMIYSFVFGKGGRAYEE